MIIHKCIWPKWLLIELTRKWFLVQLILKIYIVIFLYFFHHQGGVIVHEVHKDGAADKDGRIKPGDFIISVDGKAFKDCTHKEALQTLRFTKEKAVKIIIDRKKDGTDLYQDLQVDLSKKPGKGLGLSMVGRRDGNGVFISDMVIQLGLQNISWKANTKNQYFTQLLKRRRYFFKKYLG